MPAAKPAGLSKKGRANRLVGHAVGHGRLAASKSAGRAPRTCDQVGFEEAAPLTQAAWQSVLDDLIGLCALSTGQGTFAFPATMRPVSLIQRC